MTEFRPGTSPPPVRIPIRFFGIETSIVPAPLKNHSQGMAPRHVVHLVGLRCGAGPCPAKISARTEPPCVACGQTRWPASPITASHPDLSPFLWELCVLAYT